MTALENNPHGAGIVYRDKNGNVRIDRFLHSLEKADKIFDIINKADEYAIHFRYATHGEKNIINTHPFVISKNLCVMHNGIMNEFANINKEWSDTKNFAEYYCKDLAKEYGDKIFFNREKVKELGKRIGSGNKLVFIDKDFNISIVNEDSGTWLDGCWASNTYSINVENYHNTFKSYNKKYNYGDDSRYYDEYIKNRTYNKDYDYSLGDYKDELFYPDTTYYPYDELDVPPEYIDMMRED